MTGRCRCRPATIRPPRHGAPAAAPSRREKKSGGRKHKPEDLGKLDEGVRGKLDKRHGSAVGCKEKGPKLSWEFEEEGMKKRWETYVRRSEGAWTAADIKTLKKRWTHLVMSPVDKLTTDGLLL